MCEPKGENGGCGPVCLCSDNSDGFHIHLFRFLCLIVIGKNRVGHHESRKVYILSPGEYIDSLIKSIRDLKNCVCVYFCMVYFDLDSGPLVDRNNAN